MPLLDVSTDDLLILRDALADRLTATVKAAEDVEDPYIVTAIQVHAGSIHALRERVVEAMSPAPWPLQKALFDAAQDADAEKPRLVYMGPGDIILEADGQPA